MFTQNILQSNLLFVIDFSLFPNSKLLYVTVSNSYDFCTAGKPVFFLELIVP